MMLMLIYTVSIGGLVGLAAVFSERICADLGWPRRGVWIATIAVALLLPAWSALESSRSTETAIVSLPFTFELAPGDTQSEATPAVAGTAARSWPTWPDWQRLDNAVIAFCFASSAITLSILLIAVLSVHLTLRRSETIVVDGRRIVLSDRLGPAIFGFVRPRIILPRWIAHGRPALRRLVLDHERAHIAARDQLVLLGALAVVALMPWNIALWWQLRRLRAAIEVDCDARVLGDGADAVSYSEALLSVRQRSTAGAPLGAIALTEPVSELERRIKIMMDNARRLSISGIGGRLVLAMSAIGAALIVNAPLAQQRAEQGASPEAEAARASPAPAIRESVYKLLNEAEACTDADDVDCARERLAEVSAMDLSDYETALYWRFVGYVEFEQNNSAEAAAAYENVLDQPNLPLALQQESLRTLGRIYSGMGQYEKAFDAANRLLVLEGKPPLSDDTLAAVQTGAPVQIVKVRPVYPPRARARGIEGYVVVEYTITEAGTTADVSAVESSVPTLFDQAAVQAVEKYKYKPRVVDGRAVATTNVRDRIEFTLED